MYKLVAIDLDGTMLNSYGVVTDNTKMVIKDTIKKGVEVIIASGRTVHSIKTIANEIESKNYLIAGNGAVVYDIKNDTILYENYLSKNKVLDIIKICEENSIFYNVYTDKTILAKSLKFNVLYYYKENLKKEEDKKTKITIVENIYNYIKEMENEKILKIMICDESKTVFNSIIKKINQIKNIEILDVEHMSRKLIKHGTEEFQIQYYYTEISAENVDKWFALNFLINKLNIQKEEVIAIGDNINDKKMVENAGLGIIMEGSTPNVIKVADYITNGNNEEGVANALKKFI